MCNVAGRVNTFTVFAGHSTKGLHFFCLYLLAASSSGLYSRPKLFLLCLRLSPRCQPSGSVKPRHLPGCKFYHQLLLLACPPPSFSHAPLVTPAYRLHSACFPPPLFHPLFPHLLSLCSTPSIYPHKPLSLPCLLSVFSFMPPFTW